MVATSETSIANHYIPVTHLNFNMIQTKDKASLL